MKHFFIIANPEKEGAAQTLQELTRLLQRYDGVTAASYIGVKRKKYPIPEGTECVITIGGDGTLMHAIRSASSGEYRFIGINRGNIGYLTELKGTDSLPEAADRLVHDAFDVQERMMLRCRVSREGEQIFEDVAINEVMLARKDMLHTLKFDVYINGMYLSPFSADGMIVATPTGSTAYSMSAGGPIAQPESRLIILTPICSHTPGARSMIFSPDIVFKTIVTNDTQIVSCDGDSLLNLRIGDEVVVETSKRPMRFIRLREESFLDVLREKMPLI